MIGRTISHYRITEKLGEGGMGIVYKADDLLLGRPVALKFLRPEAFASERRTERFIREARAAAALDHPNICTIYDIREEAEHLFISMAYIEGVTLRDKIRKTRLAHEEARLITLQAAEGLGAAHKKGIIHRDVKPANIIVTPEGRVKITDFGLAKISGTTEISRSDVFAGTAAYMSPEQARGEKVDRRTDVWSLGICLYEMIAGKPPFVGDYAPAVVYLILNSDPPPLANSRPDVPRQLERIVERALAKEPKNRYVDMDQLAADLRETERDWTPVRVRRNEGADRSIGVLSFTDLSPHQDQEYFCDGIAEEIINALTQVEGLRVAARTSSFAYKRHDRSMRDIGRELGVRALLAGSVRKDGENLRISAQLVNTADGYQLWSKQFDRHLDDVFAIQDDIARHVVEALQVSFSDANENWLRTKRTRDVEAYDAYLRARGLFYRHSRQNIEGAAEMFLRAIEEDPQYALAHSGVADCYSYLFMYYGHDATHLERAQAYGARAVELAPDLAEAHASYGFALSLSEKYDAATEAFETAARLNPNLFEAYYFHARTAFARGALEQAAELFRKAGEVSPFNYQAPLLLGLVYRTMGHVAEAENVYRQALKNLERHLEANPEDARALFSMAHIYVEFGETEAALRYAARGEVLAADDPYNTYSLACIHARLDNVERALDYLEQSVRTGFAHREWIVNDNDLESIRGHARYREILDSID